MDTSTLLRTRLDDVLRLVEGVWEYVCTTQRHKLDWQSIVARKALPWTPSEAQAVWRFIAYSWKPATSSSSSTVVVEGSSSSPAAVRIDASGGLDEAESDIDERASGFRNREQFRQHLLSQRQQLPSLPLPLPLSLPRPSPITSAAAAPTTTATTVAAAAATASDDKDDEKEPAAKRPRKTWTAAEDAALLAAVRDCGSSDAWPDVRKTSGIARPPAQLAQRYVSIRKRVAKGVYGDAESQASASAILAQIDDSSNPAGNNK